MYKSCKTYIYITENINEIKKKRKQICLITKTAMQIIQQISKNSAVDNEKRGWLFIVQVTVLCSQLF